VLISYQTSDVWKVLNDFLEITLFAVYYLFSVRVITGFKFNRAGA
jgi:hypothetical protein